MDPELQALCTQTVQWYPRVSGNVNDEATYAATPTSLTARVVRRPRRLVDSQGREILATARIWLAEAPAVGLLDKIVLPDGTTAPLVVVERYPDEAGDESVMLVLGRVLSNA